MGSVRGGGRRRWVLVLSLGAVGVVGESLGELGGVGVASGVVAAKTGVLGGESEASKVVVEMEEGA